MAYGLPPARLIVAVPGPDGGITSAWRKSSLMCSTRMPAPKKRRPQVDQALEGAGGGVNAIRVANKRLKPADCRPCAVPSTVAGARRRDRKTTASWLSCRRNGGLTAFAPGTSALLLGRLRLQHDDGGGLLTATMPGRTADPGPIFDNPAAALTLCAAFIRSKQQSWIKPRSRISADDRHFILFWFLMVRPQQKKR